VTSPRTVHDLMQECAHHLPARFGFDDVLAWFERHHPGVPPSTIRTRLARRTEGSSSRPRHDGAPPALFRRVGRGVYELAPADGSSAGTTAGAQGSAVLFAVHSADRPDETQRRSRARMFAESKREAGRNGERWFGLSSHYGLIHDVDSSPSDIVMGDVPQAHGDTWAAWISIRLDAAMRSVRGKRIRIDAPEQYTLLLRPALEAHGALVEVPARRPVRGSGAASA
jgi:hypothetical protein